MNVLKQYILTIIVASILIAIVKRLTASIALGKFINIMSGVIFAIILLSPFTNIRISSYIDYMSEANFDVNEITTAGEQIYTEQMKQIITERCETYILDKANQMGANISVCIQCDNGTIPKPVHSEIRGNVSPYVRNRLIQIISQEIGIPEECQEWV